MKEAFLDSRNTHSTVWEKGTENSDLPLKGTKDSGSFGRRADMAKAHAIAQEDGQRHEARKPEQHRHGLNSQDGKFVVGHGVGEAPWDDEEVDEGEDGPDTVEDEEVDLRGTNGVPVV